MSTGVVGVFIAVTTEALSLMHGLRPLSVGACWFALTVAAVVIAHYGPRRVALNTWPWRPQGWAQALLLSYAIVITTLTVLVAVLSPPNNFDSMAYHLPRVAQWAQNHSVAFFATSDPRQLYMPPWAEYAVLHLYLLAGGDELSNLVQVAAMVVTAAATSLVAAHAGLRRIGQAVTAVLVLAIPIGLAEAPTTQTDYVLTMWLACLLASARVDLAGAATRWQCAAFGVFLGLALLTKPTAWFFAPPVVLFFTWRQIGGRLRGRQLRLPTRVRAVAHDALLVTAVVVALSGIAFGRNVATFGDLFGDDTNVSAAASVPQALVENSVRSIAVQMGTPIGPLNRLTERLTTGGLATAGMSVSDPATTKPGEEFRIGLSTREDNAGSLAATVLGLTAAGWLLARRRHHRALLLVTGMAMLGFALRAVGQPFSPYLSRYLLTWFVLLTPATAGLLTALPRRLGALVLALVCSSSLLWAVAADLRPLAGSQWLHDSGRPSLLTQSRDDAYFAVRPELAAPYQAAAARVRGLRPTTVGLLMGSNSFEYPMWALLQRGVSSPHLEHVEARFAPGRGTAAEPQVVVCLDDCPSAFPALPVRRDFGSMRVWSR